jgi:hypothetical protein
MAAEKRVFEYPRTKSGSTVLLLASYPPAVLVRTQLKGFSMGTGGGSIPVTWRSLYTGVAGFGTRPP